MSTEEGPRGLQGKDLAEESCGWGEATMSDVSGQTARTVEDQP
jgi:hypothetical protein